MDFDYECPDPPPPKDKYFEAAKEAVEELIAEHRVVTERELKVRLEDKFFPWVTNRALDELVESGRVVPQGLSGRPGRMETKKFFFLYQTFHMTK